MMELCSVGLKVGKYVPAARAVIAIGLVAFANSVAAANFLAVGSMQTDPSYGCSILLSGNIEAGDLEVLSEIVDGEIAKSSNYPDFRIERQIVLCLQSEGGSFLEGLRIAEFVSDRAITTKVMPGGQCFSACALLFMGGNLDTRSGVGWQPSRYLHPTSRLGFHAPRLDLPEQGLTRQDVDRAYASALLAIGLVSQKADKLRISQTLLTDMVSHIGEKFELIDTIDEVAINNIQLYGYSAPPMTQETSFIACWNAFRWSFYVNSFEHSLETFELEAVNMSLDESGNIWFSPWDGVMYCRHEILALGGGDKDLVIQSEQKNMSDPRVRSVSGAWIRLPGPSSLFEVPLGVDRDF